MQRLAIELNSMRQSMRRLKVRRIGGLSFLGVMPAPEAGPVIHLNVVSDDVGDTPSDCILHFAASFLA